MKKNLTFESASKRLDEILQQLSDEETPLETSLKLYAEAAEMISYCSGILKNAQNVNMLKKLNVKKCIDCGLCSYICPSKIEINEYISLAKKKVNENDI